MSSTDKRIDAYIVRSAEFARPILEHLRATVHRACTDVEETVKWGFPHFMVHGSILCSMASFKEHCAFGFWKASLLPDPRKILGAGEKSMGHLGRIRSLDDLPPTRVLLEYIRAAALLNREGVAAPRKPKAPAKPVRRPADLARALAKNAKAHATFDTFPPSQKREYIEWIAGAKTDETRIRRISTTIEWLKEGKPRNWKYMK